MTTVYIIMDEAYSLFPGADVSVPVGGAGATTYQLADELSRRPGFHVVWLFSRGVDLDGITHPTIEFRQYPTPIRFYFGSIARAINRWRAVPQFSEDGPKMLMVASWSLGWPIVDAAVGLDIPVMVRVHSDDDIRVEGLTGGGGQKLLASQGPGNWHHGVTSVVEYVAFLTEWQRSEFASQVQGAGSVVPQGWPIPKERPELSSGDHILWVGSCRPLKQPLEMVAVAKALPMESFVMVMPPYIGQRDELYERVAEAAEGVDNLHLIAEQRPISEVEQLFASAKMFVNTSVVEGFPTTFLQAASYAVPAVSLNVDPDGYLERTESGVCAGGSQAKLIAEVERLSRDRTWVEYGVRHWQHARSVHSIESCVDKLVLAIQATAR